MTRAQRIGFVVALLVLAAASAGATVAIARLGDAPTAGPAPAARGAVAGVQKTLAVAKPEATAETPGATAGRAVIGFLSALKSGDYARACDQLLHADGCEEQLAASNAGVTAFRLVRTEIDGESATVDAVADGIEARFLLVERSARWWIVELSLGR